MKMKRFKFRDRRKNTDKRTVPFKDGNGVTIQECRRKVADRRKDKIQAQWIDEMMAN